MRLLPGFRDFFPEDCQRRNYILTSWRETARRYGFVEYDGPPLESIELYKKKYVSAVPVRALSVTERRRVLDHELRSRKDAASVIRRLERGRGL